MLSRESLQWMVFQEQLSAQNGWLETKSWCKRQNENFIKEQETQVPANLLEVSNSKLLCKWVSLFTAKARKKNSSKFPPKSLYLLLAGLVLVDRKATIVSGAMDVQSYIKQVSLRKQFRRGLDIFHWLAYNIPVANNRRSRIEPTTYQQQLTMTQSHSVSVSANAAYDTVYL